MAITNFLSVHISFIWLRAEGFGAQLRVISVRCFALLSLIPSLAIHRAIPYD